jgi:hypothetical protein
MTQGTPVDPGALLLGWREWLALPDLGIDRIKAKIDTGARTSALHAFELSEFDRDGEAWVRFGMHPRQYRTDVIRVCEAPIKERRVVTDSGGHREERIVIDTTVVIAGQSWHVEMTLTGRDDMRFRMLLGRSAIRSRALVDPGRSYLTRPARLRERRRAE